MASLSFGKKDGNDIDWAYSEMDPLLRYVCNFEY